MNDKFEAFKAALHNLCVEHGFRLEIEGYFEDREVVARVATDEDPAGLRLDIEYVLAPTPEQVAAEEARKAEEKARRDAIEADRQAAYFARYGHLIGPGDLAGLTAAIEAERIEQRKKNMRVTRIPGDFNDIGDKPCRVYLNDTEITDWIAADDFRRVVETPAGARFGAVRIQLGEDTAPVEAPAMPHTALSGMFVPVPKPEAPTIEIVEAEPPAPVAAAKAPVKRSKKRGK